MNRILSVGVAGLKPAACADGAVVVSSRLGEAAR
jgi:hypothetical protein